MRRLSVAGMALLCLAGCGTPKASFYPSAATDRKLVATVVIGVDTLTDSEWRFWNYAKATGTVSKKPGDGAFFIKLPPAHSFIVMKLPVDEAGRFGPDVFALNGKAYFRYCKGDALPAVALKAGEVVYVGDVHLTKDKGTFNLAFAQDFAAAKKFVARDYPDLVANLRERPFKNLRVTSACPA
ncbi:hypothetical protein [Amantichitinum ursilacus]|uniref:DUF2846 domain-containing protein n=1 Tax=Amantichitinum ursilacus TaxID=857265 RepID=A0A0N0XHJ6_9NEIS|nr:hypothetical protein [Amantichitinum ursilacus]KPC49628.1 hypothetical protein WG78_19935 [Amantichitinum ursilacus]